MYKQIITRHKSLIASVVAIIIYALIPLFVQSPYYLDLLITMLVNAMLAMTFIMLLRTGLMTLCLAALWGVGAYTSTVLVMKFNLSFWLSLPATTLITAALALGIGYILIGSGASGLGFIILTVVIGQLFTVTVGNIAYLGGYNGITNIPPPDPIRIPFLPPIEFVSKISFFYLELFLFVVVVLIIKAFYSAWTGRAWTAIGLSPRLAESIGISILKYRLLAFALASGICGLIGSFYAHYQGFVIGDTFGMWINMYIQLYAILGGLGYAILGPLLGSAVMVFLPEVLRILREVAPIFTGILLILLIMFLPGGLLGLLDRRTAAGERVAKIGKAIESSLFTGRKESKA